MVVQGPDYCCDCGMASYEGVYADTPDGLLLALGAIEQDAANWSRRAEKGPYLELAPDGDDAWEVVGTWTSRYTNGEAYTSGERWRLSRVEVVG